ncbi:hypothetical protein C8J56DRAFT_1050388 [Mycena floridula]|nr:hypothetical protein C8J56DRAFT_1050388 [Mycena floridula]
MIPPPFSEAERAARFMHVYTSLDLPSAPRSPIARLFRQTLAKSPHICWDGNDLDRETIDSYADAMDALGTKAQSREVDSSEEMFAKSLEGVLEAAARRCRRRDLLFLEMAKDAAKFRLRQSKHPAPGEHPEPDTEHWDDPDREDDDSDSKAGQPTSMFMRRALALLSPDEDDDLEDEVLDFVAPAHSVLIREGRTNTDKFHRE